MILTFKWWRQASNPTCPSSRQARQNYEERQEVGANWGSHPQHRDLRDPQPRDLRDPWGRDLQHRDLWDPWGRDPQHREDLWDPWGGILSTEIFGILGVGILSTEIFGILGVGILSTEIFGILGVADPQHRDLRDPLVAGSSAQRSSGSFGRDPKHWDLRDPWGRNPQHRNLRDPWGVKILRTKIFWNSQHKDLRDPPGSGSLGSGSLRPSSSRFQGSSMLGSFGIGIFWVPRLRWHLVPRSSGILGTKIFRIHLGRDLEEEERSMSRRNEVFP